MEHRQTSADGDKDLTDRDRRMANLALLLMFVILVGAGVWLANAMFEQRVLDDCLAQGRRNCAPIEAPTR